MNIHFIHWLQCLGTKYIYTHDSAISGTAQKTAYIFWTQLHKLFD